MLGFSQLNAQFNIGPTAGGNYNFIILQDSENNEPPDLYGSAAGFYGGVNGKYQFSDKFSLGGELLYQSVPFTLKYVTGVLYQGYATIAVQPSYRIFPQLAIEGGLGTGITVQNRLVSDNDPIFFGSLGLKVPVRNFEINARYYRFLKPHFVEETDRSERKLYNHGIQVGLTYYLFG